LRSIHETIVPFEAVFIGFLGLVFGEILFGMIKLVPVKDKRTGKTKRWAIGTLNLVSLINVLVSESNISTQEPGFICLHPIDSISKPELL